MEQTRPSKTHQLSKHPRTGKRNSLLVSALGDYENHLLPEFNPSLIQSSPKTVIFI